MVLGRMFFSYLGVLPLVVHGETSYDVLNLRGALACSFGMLVPEGSQNSRFSVPEGMLRQMVYMAFYITRAARTILRPRAPAADPKKAHRSHQQTIRCDHVSIIPIVSVLLLHTQHR